MIASLSRIVSRAGGIRRRWWIVVPVVPVVLTAILSWWFTESLTDRGASHRPTAGTAPVEVPADVKALAAETKSPPKWPESSLAGHSAKVRLLDVLAAAAERLNRVETYTATFRKQERLNGRLGPLQTLEMKVRQKPFAIYFKFLTPQDGKEVVYAEGHHDNKLIAHAGGVARFLVPRLAVAPDHPLALADARHPITEAGLANMTARLLHYRAIDLQDFEAETVLDRTTDAQGRILLRSVHTHAHQSPERPFARIEVLYDPLTYFPIDIRNYDWPTPGHPGDLQLAERYTYDNLNLNASLTATDFDPANPAYAFHRY